MSFIKSIVALFTAIMMSLGFVHVGDIEVTGVPEHIQDTVRIVSFNLRTADDIYGSVKNRSRFISATLEAYEPDSFGVQEANPKWISLLDEQLGEKYDHVGQPRNNSSNTEYSCVYYLKDKYELLDSGTIWLSKTPEVFGSKSFLSTLPRIATWATLKDKENGLVYTHINTHLDHILESTRQKQAEVLVAKINELTASAPVVCTGDFNMNEGRAAYKTMTAAMDDSRLVAEITQSGKTFHDYGRGDITHTSAIDFIFVEKGTRVARYKIIDNMVEKMYLSDHYGLCADIYI